MNQVRPKIIAEIGWNHMGDMDLANKMIQEASNSGADIAKFQTWKVDRLKNGDWDNDGRREIYIKAELSEEKHKFLIQSCRDKSIKFMSSAFSVEDAELLNKLNCKCVKIPSFEIANKPLLLYCKENFSTIYVSTGTANATEINALSELFSQWEGKLIVMHCVSAYPCKASQINLPRIKHLKKLFPLVGFSDHTQGILSTIASIEFLPEAIEKHFTIDHSLPGRDNKFAILPKEMNLLSKYIDSRIESLNDHGINFQEIENTSRDNYRGRFNG